MAPFLRIPFLLMATVATMASAAVTITADIDTCFMVGNAIRAQFAIEGLDIPEPGDVFVATIQSINKDTKAPIVAVPQQIFNGAAAQGNPPSLIVGTQSAEINRVAGFIDFDLGNVANQGLTCNGGKMNADFIPISYVQNKTPVTVTNAGPVNGAGAAGGTVAAIPLCTNALKQATTAQTSATTAARTPATTAARTLATTAATVAVGCPATVVQNAATTAPIAASAAATKATSAAAGGVVGGGAVNTNPNPVTVTYDGSCNGNSMQLTVKAAAGGNAFKPDAANPGGGVPCDEYFELSFSFVDKVTGAAVVFPVAANSFFNAKSLTSDAAGNIFAQFSPEIDGFGSGFLPLGGSLTCVGGTPNFKIRTNYLLTALNDGTYTRNLNAVTDAGTFGSGQATKVPANAADLELGQAQCNIGANKFITFPFPA